MCCGMQRAACVTPWRTCRVVAHDRAAADQPTPRSRSTSRRRAGRAQAGRRRRNASTSCRAFRSAALRGAEGVRRSSCAARPDPNSLTSVRRLLIDTPSGGHARLGDVASVRIAPEPANIMRRRRTISTSTWRWRPRPRRRRERHQARAKGLALPLEYHAMSLGGETACRQAIAIAVAAAVGIFLFCRHSSAAGASPPLRPSRRSRSAAAHRDPGAGGGTMSFGLYAALFLSSASPHRAASCSSTGSGAWFAAGEAFAPPVVDAAGERFVPV